MDGSTKCEYKAFRLGQKNLFVCSDLRVTSPSPLDRTNGQRGPMSYPVSRRRLSSRPSCLHRSVRAIHYGWLTITKLRLGSQKSRRLDQ